MNLTNFLKQTDVLTEKYSASQLALFIHETGRLLPEEHREDFLKRLRALGDAKEAAAIEASGVSADEVYENVKRDFDKIESEEVSIFCELNEEYDDWYGGEEFFYEDHDGISEMLARACDFIHICMDTEQYGRGKEIGERLFGLRISICSEYGDEDFSVRDMVCHNLMQRDLGAVALDALYCGYHAVSMEKRPETLYGIITDAREKKLSLEALMQHGDEELPEFQDFLKAWTVFLGEKTGEYADVLFLEAVELCDDVQTSRKYAKQFADVHPALYLKLLENGKGASVEDMASIGDEAMEKVPSKYIIRGKIALKTAEYLIAANAGQESVERCY